MPGTWWQGLNGIAAAVDRRQHGLPVAQLIWQIPQAVARNRQYDEGPQQRHGFGQRLQPVAVAVEQLELLQVGEAAEERGQRVAAQVQVRDGRQRAQLLRQAAWGP